MNDKNENEHIENELPEQEIPDSEFSEDELKLLNLIAEMIVNSVIKKRNGHT